MTGSIRALLLVLLAASALAAAPAGLPAADSAGGQAATTFSGRATVVDGTVAGVPVTLVDTGPVAPEGGSLEESLLCYPDQPGLCVVGLPDITNEALQLEVLHAAVVAGGSRSHAEASAASALFSVAEGLRVFASFASASATAECSGGAASVFGDTTITQLVIAGEEVLVTGEVNQQVPIPGVDGGFVVVNEQVATVDGDRGDITVTALHIVVPGVMFPDSTEFLIPPTDVRLAQAHADITCANDSEPPDEGCGKMTGGGWYTWAGDRVHFAFAARDGVDTWGHLLYEHKAIGLKVKGRPAVSTLTYEQGSHNDGRAVSQGPAQSLRRFGVLPVGWYEVIAIDEGEPGRDDRFAIVLLTGPRAMGGRVLYSANVDASGTVAGDETLEGGNLQFHPCKADRKA
jgi:hypothetical protein